MKTQNKSKEELINELQELQKVIIDLKVSAEADLVLHKQAIDALKASEERFELLFNKAPLGYQSLDFDGNFIEVNQQWLETLGYERDEVIGKWFGNFLTPGFRDGFRKRFPIFKELGKIHSEFEMVHKNGSILFIAFDGKIGYDLKGEFKQTHCILQDITDIKKTEKALKESEEKYRLLHENAGIGIGYYKVDGTIISYNNIAARNMNGVPEDFNGKSIYNLFPKSIAEYYHDRIKKAVASEIPVSYEDEVELPLGKKYFISIYSRIINVNGEIEGIQILSHDITDRRLAEAALKESEETLFTTLQSIGDGVISTDNIGLVVNMNPVAETLCGWKLSEAKGNPLSDVFTIINAETRQPDIDPVKKVLEKGEIVGLANHTILVSKNGTEYQISDSAAPIKNKAGVITGIVLVFSDISATYDAQKQLKLSEEKFSKSFINSPDSIIINRLHDGKIVTVNNGFRKIMGYKDSEVIGKTTTELKFYKNPEERNAIIHALKTTGEARDIECWFVSKHGEEILGLMSAAIINIDGVKHIISTSRDITHRKLAEKKLKQSEERFALVIEASEQGIWDWNVETNEVFYSEQWKRQIGYEDHELKNEFNTWVEHLHPEERESCQIAIQSYLLNPIGHFVLDFRFRHKDGNYRWIHNKAASIQNSDGKVIRMFGTHNDFTESKHSESIFKDIIEKNPLSIQILDMEGYPIQENSAHTQLFGVKPPSSYSVFKDPQLLSLGFGKLFEQIKKGEVVYFPDSYYNVHNIDPSFPNSAKWVKAVGFALNDTHGKPYKIVLMHENITEQKNSEALLNDIIENNPLSIQVVDNEGHTVRVNPSFLKLFGLMPPPEFSIFDDLKSKSPELENLVYKVKNGEIIHLPDLYYNPHDSVPEAPDNPRWIRALIFPLNDSGGNPQSFVFMHENITERKLAEQELLIAKVHAEESDRLKSAFLANMSHEIRTPMNGILGFAELLKEPDLSGEEQQEYIGIIEKSGNRMLTIINDIIDISKIEANLMKVDIKECFINDKIEFIYNFFIPQVEEKGIKLIFRNSLPDIKAKIRTDYEKFFSIITNLVKNAIKFTKEGSIEFGYDLVETSQTETYMQFYVKDTGIGIPKDRQLAIFEQFIQADISDKMARQGAGLGLAISKAYVEMLGGKIWVDSEEGIGSTFYFTLPYDSIPK